MGKMMPIGEAAMELGISRGRLRRAIDAGEIPVLTLNVKQLVDMDAAARVVATWASDGVGIDAVSTATGLPKYLIRQGAREGWIPHWTNGRWLRFDLAAVLAAIERRIAEQRK